MLAEMGIMSSLQEILKICEIQLCADSDCVEYSVLADNVLSLMGAVVFKNDKLKSHFITSLGEFSDFLWTRNDQAVVCAIKVLEKFPLSTYSDYFRHKKIILNIAEGIDRRIQAVKKNQLICLGED